MNFKLERNFEKLNAAKLELRVNRLSGRGKSFGKQCSATLNLVGSDRQTKSCLNGPIQVDPKQTEIPEKIFSLGLFIKKCPSLLSFNVFACYSSD